MYFVLESLSYPVHAFAQLRDDFSYESQVMTYLEAQSKRGDKATKGFRALFRRYAELGPTNVPKEAFHEVDRNAKIWEFIKGDHRVFCFRRDNVVVLTNAAMKKTQKVDPAEVKKAIAARTVYEQFRGAK